MEKGTSDLARMVVDKLVTSDNSREIVDALKDALYQKAIEKVDQKKMDRANEMLFGKKRDEMEYVDAKLPKGADDKRADYDNDELLKTGENEAGGVEALAYYKGQKRGSMGHMNPVGVPERPFAGDRRANRPGGPEMPYFDGTIPN